MRWILNLIYVCLLVAVSPWLIFKALRTGKYREGLWTKITGRVPRRDSDQPCVWFHAVSVGEVLLLGKILRAFQKQHGDVEIVVSTTTNTGMQVARSNYPGCHLIYFPMDFSWAVDQALQRIRPDAIVLAELELWPNFILTAQTSEIPVVVMNARMSPRSVRGYGRARHLIGWMFRSLSQVCAQTVEYAEHFSRLGVADDRVHVTGSIKYDGLETDRNNDLTSKLRLSLALNSRQSVWVAGSTSSPEEAMVLSVYRNLLDHGLSFKLIIVPRHKERFEETAQLILKSGFGLLRRSDFTATSQTQNDDVILVDTLGELGAVWGLADVAFVGGSFAPRGGQNMIEPAAYGAGVVVGPGTWNFKETVTQLLLRDAICQVFDQQQLQSTIMALLEDPVGRDEMGKRARRFVLDQQGATERTLRHISRRVA